MFALSALKRLPQPPWYRKLEQWLAPSQPLVIALLVGIAGVSLWLAWKGPNWLRTLWAVYVIIP